MSDVMVEPGQMAAQVSAQHCRVGQILIRPNNCAVRARSMGHWAEHWQTSTTVREPTERTGSNWGWEV